MRLLVATHSSHTRGGAERYLGGVLPPLQKMGWEVHLASEDDASGELARLVPTTPSQLNDEVDAADVVLVNGLYSLRFEERLLRRPAVLFAHNYYGTCLSGEKRHRWPSPVCCERALGPACFPLYFARGCGSASPLFVVDSARRQLARRRLLGRYQRIVVGSEHMRREFERHVPGRVVHVPLFAPAATVDHEPRKSGRFVFVGRMTPVKGGLLLVRAAAELQRQLGVRIELVFIGEGSEQRRLEALCRSSGISSWFTGWLEPLERDRILATACALVLPSLWPEPFGLVGLEAGRVGVPTVAFAVGGIPDWLVDGVNGALVPLRGDLVMALSSGMRRALVDFGQGGAWGSNASARAAVFSLEAHIAKLSEVLRQAAEIAQ